LKRETRYALESAALGAARSIARVVPRSLFIRLGRSLGAFTAAVDRKHREIAKDNLRRSFPDWSETEIDRVARAVWVHFGGVMFDLVRLLARGPAMIPPLVTLEGREHAESARSSGRGVVIVTAHFGNWEAHGIAHGQTFGSIGVVARPLDNPAFDRVMTALREGAGNEVIAKEHAMIRSMRRIKEGRGVAFLVDQNVQAKEGIFVNFFGRPACTTPFAAKLAIRTGAMVLPCRTVMTDDFRYRVIYDAPIDPKAFVESDEGVRALTQAMVDTTERWIRSNPEQWLWMHRRWHTKPPSPAAA